MCDKMIMEIPLNLVIRALHSSGLSSLGVPGVPWHTQSLADQLTLFQPGGTEYAQLISTGTPGFSDLPTALTYQTKNYFLKIEIMIYLCLAKTRLD